MHLRYLVKALWGQTAPKGFAKERVVMDPVPAVSPSAGCVPQPPSLARAAGSNSDMGLGLGGPGKSPGAPRVPPRGAGRVAGWVLQCCGQCHQLYLKQHTPPNPKAIWSHSLSPSHTLTNELSQSAEMNWSTGMCWGLRHPTEMGSAVRSAPSHTQCPWPRSGVREAAGAELGVGAPRVLPCSASGCRS